MTTSNICNHMLTTKVHCKNFFFYDIFYDSQVQPYGKKQWLTLVKWFLCHVLCPMKRALGTVSLFPLPWFVSYKIFSSRWVWGWPNTHNYAALVQKNVWKRIYNNWSIEKNVSQRIRNYRNKKSYITKKDPNDWYQKSWEEIAGEHVCVWWIEC